MGGGGAPPTGTVTFLFTDIEGSTRLWEQFSEQMSTALARHDELLREAIAGQGGWIFSTAGDGVGAAFPAATGALAAAVEAQQAFGVEPWPRGVKLRVRMGLHVGEAVERAGDYFGPAVNLAARLMSGASGGQVVCSSAVADLVSREFEYRDLGQHRFRDVEMAVHVMQVCAPGLADEFPALRSLDECRTNLPNELSTFVGREHDIVEVTNALRDSRMVSVVGVGGVGKTRLARRVAAEMLGAFADGVWLCELASLRDPESVWDAVASALRYAPPSGVDLRTSLIQFLERKELLLVLDNCEHLIVASARLASDVLAAARGVQILATSREPLGVTGEHVYAAPSLGLPTSADAASVGGSDSGRLFAARAADARHGWTLDGTNAAAVAEICRRLDGIPLALELAAGRTAVMEPTEIAKRLDERFVLLSGGSRTASERHQTLRAAIDWSYELLEPNEQQVLRQVSTFVGGFDLDALTAVADADGSRGPAIVEVLASLVGKSLVEHGDASVGRYRTLETIRQYAAERLDAAGETRGARDRHADHYLRVMRQAFAELRTPDDYGAVDRLVLDAGNIVAAMEWSAATGRAAAALEPFHLVPPFLFTELPVTVAEPLARTIEAIVATIDPNVDGYSAACCCALGVVLDAGDRPRLDRLVEHARRSPPDVYTATAEAFPHGARGDMPGGAAATELALDRLGADGDPLFRSELLGLLAIFIGKSDPPRSRVLAEESVALARAHGGGLALLYPLMTLTLGASQSDPDEALAAAEECSRLDRTARRLQSSVAISLAAYSCADHGDVPRALTLFRESVVHLDRAGHRTSLAIVLGTIGEAIAGDDPDRALSLACLSQSGAIAPVGTLSNEYYMRLRALAAERGDAEVDRMCAELSHLSYDEATRYVLDTLDDLTREFAGRDARGSRSEGGR